MSLILAAVALALDGESVAGNNTAIAVISVVSIVFGYLLLAGLWYFVFSAKASSRRRPARSAGRPPNSPARSAGRPPNSPARSADRPPNSPARSAGRSPGSPARRTGRLFHRRSNPRD
jgi:hypothetical protein